MGRRWYGFFMPEASLHTTARCLHTARHAPSAATKFGCASIPSNMGISGGMVSSGFHMVANVPWEIKEKSRWEVPGGLKKIGHTL
jgi:hypothetical protein